MPSRPLGSATTGTTQANPLATHVDQIFERTFIDFVRVDRTADPKSSHRPTVDDQPGERTFTDFAKASLTAERKARHWATVRDQPGERTFDELVEAAVMPFRLGLTDIGGLGSLWLWCKAETEVLRSPALGAQGSEA